MCRLTTGVFVFIITRIACQGPGSRTGEQCPLDRRIEGIQCGQVRGRMNCPSGSTCLPNSVDVSSVCCWDVGAQEAAVESPCMEPLLRNDEFVTCTPGDTSKDCPGNCHSCQILAGVGVGVCCPATARSGCENISPAGSKLIPDLQPSNGAGGGMSGVPPSSGAGETPSGGYEAPCMDPLLSNDTFVTCTPGDTSQNCPGNCHSCQILAGVGVGVCCPETARSGCENSSPTSLQLRKLGLSADYFEASSTSQTGSPTRGGRPPDKGFSFGRQFGVQTRATSDLAGGTPSQTGGATVRVFGGQGTPLNPWSSVGSDLSSDGFNGGGPDVPPPSRGAGVPPPSGARVSPSRGAGVPPSRAAGVRPQRGAGVLPAPDVDVPPSRGVDVPSSRGVGVSPSRSVSVPPSRGAVAPPSRSAGVPPTRGTEVPPPRSWDVPPPLGVGRFTGNTARSMPDTSGIHMINVDRRPGVFGGGEPPAKGGEQERRWPPDIVNGSNGELPVDPQAAPSPPRVSSRGTWPHDQREPRTPNRPRRPDTRPRERFEPRSRVFGRPQFDRPPVEFDRMGRPTFREPRDRGILASRPRFDFINVEPSPCDGGERPRGSCHLGRFCRPGLRCVRTGFTSSVCCPEGRRPPFRDSRDRNREPRGPGPGLQLPTSRRLTMPEPDIGRSGSTTTGGRCPPQTCVRHGRHECYSNEQCSAPSICCSPAPNCVRRCVFI